MILKLAIFQNNKTKFYLNTIIANGFEFMNRSPTRDSESRKSCVDSIIVRKIIDFEVSVLDTESFSDHYPVTLSIKFNPLMPKKQFADYLSILKQK